MDYFSGIALDMLKIKAFTMEGLKSVVAERERGIGTPLIKALI